MLSSKGQKSKEEMGQRILTIRCSQVLRNWPSEVKSRQYYIEINCSLRVHSIDVILIDLVRNDNVYNFFTKQNLQLQLRLVLLLFHFAYLNQFFLNFVAVT